MKRIYFIRHGQTDCNNQRVFQDDLERLNEIGMQQSKSVAEKFVGGKARVVCVSPLVRAQETAQIMADVSGFSLETLDILKEMMNPPIVRGRSYDEPVASEAYDEWLSRMLINESYGRDEVENFFDLSLRAGQVLDMLAARSEDEIIVVTHSVMIRAIVARVIMGKNASPDVIQHFQDNVKIHNTGVVSVIVLNDNGKIQYKVAFE